MDGGQDCRFSSLLSAASHARSLNRCLPNTYPSQEAFSASHGAQGPEPLYISLLLHMHPGGRKQIFPIKTNHCALIHPSFGSSRCSWVAAGSSPSRMAPQLQSASLNRTAEPGVPWDSKRDIPFLGAPPATQRKLFSRCALFVLIL